MYCFGALFCLACRYAVTLIDASILTQSLSAIQRPETVNGITLISSVSTRIFLSAISLTAEWSLTHLQEQTEQEIRQMRTQKVMAAFYILDFNLMTGDNFSRFMLLAGNITHYPVYFKEPIDIICRLIEVFFIAAVVIRNVVKLTPLLAGFCVVLSGLHTVKVLSSLPVSYSIHGVTFDRVKTWDARRPKSLAERRTHNLQNLAFREESTARDIVLHGAAPWLIQSFENASKLIPNQGETPDKTHVQAFFAQTLSLLEIVGVPALSILVGETVSFGSYYLVQQSLGSICRNAAMVEGFLRNNIEKGFPYAKEYTQCLELASSCERQQASKIDVPGPINSLEVRDLHFRYPKPEAASTHKTPGEKIFLSPEKTCGDSVLKGITFEFQRGKVYSIVGKNGGGKSTLVNILTKLYSPSRGSVRVNGIDLEDVSSTSWQRRLAIAPQEFSELWYFTIRENIGLGQASLLNEDPENVIEQEARACGVTAFVDLDTHIGSLSLGNRVPGCETETWKSDFSGGQWQSIALARTLCRTRNESVEVLIMDEPSSSLDPIAEHRLFERLRREREQRITIFISHRLQTTRASDCILVIDEGNLVESGSHEELLHNEKGLYRLMYTTQTANLV
jgi:ABC-type multidrug transport system fused ATPase/permease subunit